MEGSEWWLYFNFLVPLIEKFRELFIKPQDIYILHLISSSLPSSILFFDSHSLSFYHYFFNPCFTFLSFNFLSFPFPSFHFLPFPPQEFPTSTSVPPTWSLVFPWLRRLFMFSWTWKPIKTDTTPLFSVVYWPPFPLYYVLPLLYFVFLYVICFFFIYLYMFWLFFFFDFFQYCVIFISRFVLRFTLHLFLYFIIFIDFFSIYSSIVLLHPFSYISDSCLDLFFFFVCCHLIFYNASDSGLYMCVWFFFSFFLSWLFFKIMRHVQYMIHTYWTVFWS